MEPPVNRHELAAAIIDILAVKGVANLEDAVPVLGSLLDSNQLLAATPTDRAKVALEDVLMRVTGHRHLTARDLWILVDCNARIRSDAMSGGTVDPLHRLGRVVVFTDVAHELSLEIGERGKHAACDHVALDLSEPQLDLVEPGRIGRGVMQMQVGMLDEKRIDALGLVRREVVADDMDLFAPGLMSNDVGEEGHELGAGVPRRCLTQNFARLGVEGGIKRQRAVTVILESVSLDATRRKRQHRIEPIQGLNGTLLIDAEHRGMRRWVQVQADDIGGLGFEVRIVGGHVTLQPMGLEPMLGPDAGHHHVRDPQRSPQLARAPMCRAIAWGLLRPGQHSSFQLGGVIGRRAPTMAGVQSAKSLSFKASLPAVDVIGCTRQRSANRAPARPLVKHDDQPSSLHLGNRRSPRARKRLEHTPLFRSQTECRVHASYDTTDINVTVH